MKKIKFKSVTDLHEKAEELAKEYLLKSDLLLSEVEILKLKTELELNLDIINNQPSGIYRIRVTPKDDWEEDAWNNGEHPPYTFELANNRFCEILAINPDILKTNPGIINELVYSDDKAEFILKNEEANDKLIPFKWEGRMVVKGEIIWVHIESIPRPLENGDVFWTGFLFDITESRMTEYALRESENRLSILFANSPDAYLLIEDGVFVDCNLASEVMLKGNRSRIVGQRLETLSPEYQDIGKKSSDIADEIIKEVLQKGNKTFEWKLRKFDGPDFYVEVSISSMMLDGKQTLFVTWRDVTERIQAENELQVSEKKYRSIFENIQDVYYETTLDGFILEVSPSVEFVSKGQYHRSDLIGKSMSDYYSDPNAHETIIALLKQTGNVKDFETQFKNLDGSNIYCSLSASICFDAEGQIEKIVGSVHDISERKLMVDALKLSEEKFSKAFKSTPDLIMITSLADGRIVEVNERVLELTGYTYDEFIGKTTNELNYWADPEDRIRFVNHLLQYGLVHNMEIKFRLKSGEIRNNLVFGEILELQNEKFILGVNHDITELKQAEETLIKSEANLAEAMRIAKLCFWEYDIVSDQFTFNDEFYKLYYTSAEREGGYQMSSSDYALKFVPPDDFNVVADEIQKALQTTDPNYLSTFDRRLVIPSGEIEFVSVNIHIVKDANGRTVKIFGVNQNITERKKAEEKIIKLNRVNVVLSNVNHAIVNIREKQELFDKVSQIAIEDGKFIMACIGIVNQETNKVDVVASCGKTDGYLDIINIDINDVIRSQGPTGTSIKTGMHCLCNNIDTDERMIPWRENALECGYKSSIALPFEITKSFKGAITLYSNEVDSFNEEEIELLDKLAMDISFALEFIETESERKQAEEALKESERLLRESQEVAGLGSYAWNLTDGLWASSKILDRIFGINESYIRNLEGWLAIIHPDWRKVMHNYVTKDVVGKHQKFDMEYQIVNQENKQVRWVHGLGQIEFDSNNQPLKLIGTILDITGQKQVEEKLRESEEKLSILFASMTEMVVIHELILNEQGDVINYKIVDCNDAFTEALGVKKEDVIGKLATDVYQTDKAPYLDKYSRVAITGESYEHNVYYAPLDKHFLISAVSTGENLFSTIITDITDIQLVKDEITAKNKELENFIYVTSHDLRSPLVNIQGFSQRLKNQTSDLHKMITNPQFSTDTKLSLDKLTNEDIPKSLNFILSNVTKMDTLINGLLQISRTGRTIQAIRKVGMNQLLKAIVANHNFQLTEVDANVLVKNLHDCYGDENQLNQLFSNIIANAIKYRDKNRKLVIEISSESKVNKIIYSIKDTGIGINSNQLEKIWDVFYRVDTTSSEVGEGLGLSLAKRIAERNRGKIWAKSEEGKGTIFFVELQKKEFSEN